MALSDFYNKRVKIYSSINVGTNIRPVYTWILLNDLGENSGLIDETRVFETLKRDNLETEWDYILIIDPTTITEKERVVIGSHAYDVKGIDNPNGMDHHYEIKIKRLDQSQYEETVNESEAS